MSSTPMPDSEIKVDVVAECGDGRVIPYLGRAVWDVSEDDDWIEVLWQGEDVISNGTVVPALNQHPSLIMYRESAASSDGVGALCARYVATLRSHIWAAGGHAIPPGVEEQLPQPYVILTDNAPSALSREDLRKFAHHAVEKLCELYAARDDRVVAHFLPDRDDVPQSHDGGARR